MFATNVGIVGVGLIGGSIASALRKREFAGRIFGLGRNLARLEQARAAGLIDVVTTDAKELAADCDLCVVCTPVDRIVADVRALAGSAKPGSLLTDAGSTKSEICAALATGLPKGVTFIGSHPLAGSEKQGFEHSDADLYVGRVTVLTPDSQTPPSELARLRRFWEFLGSIAIEMPADAHDRALAQTSHVPHVAAAAVALTLETANARLTAGGFRDTTRIAAGDPDLWSAILLSNRAEVVAGIESLERHLSELRQAVRDKNGAALKKLLELAKTKREALPKP
jgi:prephenate dehydrogenase